MSEPKMSLSDLCVANGYPPIPQRPHEKILREVLTKYKTNLATIKGVSRKKGNVAAKAEIYYRFYKELGWPYNRIAKFFNKDHTTIRHLVLKVEKIGIDGASTYRWQGDRRRGPAKAAGSV